jgi:hypothetical protein
VEGGGWVRDWGDLRFFQMKKRGTAIPVNYVLGDLKLNEDTSITFKNSLIIYEGKILLLDNVVFQNY